MELHAALSSVLSAALFLECRSPPCEQLVSAMLRAVFMLDGSLSQLAIRKQHSQAMPTLLRNNIRIEQPGDRSTCMLICLLQPYCREHSM